MNHFVKQFGLPLLSKELIEQSARKRTYVLRALYAIVLYSTTLWAFQQQLGSWNDIGLSVLGRGRGLYLSLAWLQFAGIYIFLPAMTCSVLTAEKERETLGLLLLTKLGPWTIVFEKLFSRLVPMAMFVLLSMPLLAVAYSLGGLEATDIIKLMWVLAATAIQVGSFAVLCSAWFRTTAAAFLGSYLLGTISILIFGVLFQVSLEFWFTMLLGGFFSSAAHEWLITHSYSSPNSPAAPLLAFGPTILNGGELLGTAFQLPEQTLLDCFLMTIPMLGLAMMNLFAARMVLWKRAFVQPKNLLVRVFRSLDGFFQRANQNKLTRGIVLIKESVALPLYHPISWRETTKKSLGTTRYLIRMLLLMELPVLVMILWPVDESQVRSGFAPPFVTEACLWLVAILVLSIQSTGLIGTERSRQTLDVLLTIPLESKEIIAQKFAGIWRMIFMLGIPFATIYVFQIWWGLWIGYSYTYTYGSNFGFSAAEQIPLKILRAILSVTLYLPAIAWFGFYEGLSCRSQTQAILVTMTAIIAICLVPLAGIWFAPDGLARLVVYLSPVAVAIVAMNVVGPRDWVILIGHFFIVSLILIYFSYQSRRVFAARVGRNDGVADEDIEIPVAALSHDERLARLRRKTHSGISDLADPTEDSSR